MADGTKIEWTDATVNFWWGCTKVGPGCDYCYAEMWAARFGEQLWGVGAPRRKIKSAVKLLHRLNNDYSWWSADHHIGGMHAMGRRRVFIQSMSDLFDLEVALEWFDEAWTTIEACDRLHLQLVTKRLPAVEKRLAAIGRRWPSHAGLIISVVNQAEADRDLDRLREIKAKLSIPWVGLSVEPMQGPIVADLTGIDWVICGGESGPNARPMDTDWARSLRDQCQAAGVPFFFKQHGEWIGVDTLNAEQREEAGDLNRMRGDPLTGSVWLGKKRAGRLLDGVEHNGMPA